METVSNPIQACNDVFFRPRAVFATLKERNNWSWIPFALVVMMALLPSYMYYQFVDFSWFTDMLIAKDYAEVSPAEQDQVRNYMTPGVMTFNVLVFGFLGIVVINAIMAIYLNVTSKMDDDCVMGFTDWYGFCWWAGMPTLIGGLISLLLIALASDHQLSPAYLSPLSLAFIAGVDFSSEWFNLLSAMRLENVWSMYLIAVGVCQWTKLPSNKAWIIAIAPYLIIWGLMAVFVVV
ncbi:YIP1 family protein [Aestuariibacter halophilus]|uniref:YIP1 family protein n=1 Tax=Fluctibacter halophilus TaxID=226011 RepID=A0ABS8G8G9_9ALTE|nr:Yip1 family protein [Aestuariibacter halophilus]MCC2616835.1 YIP1 family protein [Aestuariibacter halophilus]